MKTARNFSQRIGTALGKAWQGWLRAENGFARITKKIGVPVVATKIVLRLLLVAGFAKLLFVTGAVSFFWAILQIFVFMVLLLVILVNWPSFLGESSPSPQFSLEDEDDHRNQPGYDRYFYPEDDPDPRFKD